MSRYIAVEIDGKTNVHAASSIAGYGTLCGLDAGISDDDQREVPLIIGARIDCKTCFQIISEAKTFRARDFCRTLKP